MKNLYPQSVLRIQCRILKSERAFSLLDTLVALTIVSTVATVAVPSFQQFIANQRLTGAVNSLVTMLHLARSEAIKRRERAVLCPSVDGRTCGDNNADETAWEDGYLLYIDRDANNRLDVDETIVRISDAAKGLHIRSATGRNHVTYQSNGLASGTNLTVTFCDKRGRSHPRAVVVSNGGRPYASTRGPRGRALVCATAS